MDSTRASLMTLVLVSCCGQVLAQGLPLMDTEMEALDGLQRHVAGPSDATSNPDLLRVWLAQGRRRAVYQVDNRVRQPLEEAKDFTTKLLAVEIDEANDRLFSLSARVVPKDPKAAPLPAVIRVDNIFSPGAPLNLQKLMLPETLSVHNLRVLPSEKKLLLLSGAQVAIYDYDNASLTLEPKPMSSFQVPTGSAACGTFVGLRSAKVHTVGGKRMAFFAAAMNHGFPKPLAQGLLVADLDNLHNPFFYQADLTKQAWDPCPTASPAAEFALRDFVIVDEGARHYAYVVGGTQLQIKKLDVTDVANPAIGIQEVGTGDFNSSGPLFWIGEDPLDPTYFNVLGTRDAYVVDKSDLNNPVSTSSDFGDRGHQRDALLMLEGANELKVWSFVELRADHHFKITTTTQDGVPPLEPPTVGEHYYAAGVSDGGVAVFGWSAVYTPNFGGVVRWDWHNGAFHEQTMACNVYAVSTPISGFAGPGTPAVTLKVVLPKTTEGFAIVRPLGF